MGRKRKRQGRSAVPSTSKSSKLVVVGSSSASSASTSANGEDGSGVGSRSSPIAPGSGSGQRFLGQLHPLLNPVVLSNLFSFCPPGLLANCRLVCKTWRDAALPAWRSSATPKIIYYSGDETDGFIYLDVGKSSSKMTLTEFQELWGNEYGDPPYQSIHLVVREYEFGMGNGVTVLGARLLELVRSRVKKVTLFACTFRNVAAFRTVIYQSFPNLQSLALDCSRMIDGIPEEQPGNDPAHLEPAHVEHLHLKSVYIRSRASMSVPVSWVEFLSHFPALSSIKFVYQKPRYNVLYRGTFWAFERNLGLFLDAVIMIRRNDPSKLPELSLDIDPSLELTDARVPPIFNRLRQLNLHLGSVKISLNSSFNAAKNLIKLHGRRLTKIETFMSDMVYNERASSPSPFPKMELTCLQELTLSDVFCKSMEFLKYTPNLRTLRIFNMPAGLNYVRGDEVIPLPTGIISRTRAGKKDLANLKLPTLTHLYFGYKLNQDDLNRLFNWFPNVEILTAFLDNELFASVCENWPNLKHLHVLGAELNDQGVTGVGGRGVACRPNVKDLKKLLCFQMESNSEPSICITDASALQGFLKLRKLRHLKISRFSHSFSPAMVDKLETKIPDCRIRRQSFWQQSNGSRDSCPDVEY